MRLSIILFFLLSVSLCQACQYRLTPDQVVTLIQDYRAKSDTELWPVRKILGEVVAYAFLDEQKGIYAKYDIDQKLELIRIKDADQCIREFEFKELFLPDGIRVAYSRDDHGQAFVFTLQGVET